MYIFSHKLFTRPRCPAYLNKRMHERVCFVRSEQSLSPPGVLVMNCNSFLIPYVFWLFTLTESLQAVCAGVLGQIQCEEDALRYPPQTFSQRTQKGIQNLFFIIIIIVDSRVIQKNRPDTKKNCSCPQVLTPVVWNKPDIENSVPLWIIILAILAGLLLLALLIYVLYKVSGLRLLVFSHHVIL